MRVCETFVENENYSWFSCSRNWSIQRNIYIDSVHSHELQLSEMALTWMIYDDDFQLFLSCTTARNSKEFILFRACLPNNSLCRDAVWLSRSFNQFRVLLWLHETSHIQLHAVHMFNSSVAGVVQKQQKKNFEPIAVADRRYTSSISLQNHVNKCFRWENDSYTHLKFIEIVSLDVESPCQGEHNLLLGVCNKV